MTPVARETPFNGVSEEETEKATLRMSRHKRDQDRKPPQVCNDLQLLVCDTSSFRGREGKEGKEVVN